jgi:hypothetical protein
LDFPFRLGNGARLRRFSLFEQSALPLKLLRHRLVDSAPAVSVRRSEQPHLRVTGIVPAGISSDRIDAEAIDPHAALHRLAHFAADIMEPGGPRRTLGSCLGEEDRLPVAGGHLLQHVGEAAVIVVPHRERRTVDVPLIVRVEVEADRVEHVGAAAKLAIAQAEEHVRCLRTAP